MYTIPWGLPFFVIWLGHYDYFLVKQSDSQKDIIKIFTLAFKLQFI